jgi:hypothetical protein
MTRDDEDTLQAELGKLAPDDRRLARAQEYCPVRQNNRLGLMGAPVKITIKGQAVFLCCKGCVDEAREHPDQTLANLEKLKSKVKGSPAARPAPTLEGGNP